MSLTLDTKQILDWQKRRSSRNTKRKRYDVEYDFNISGDDSSDSDKKESDSNVDVEVDVVTVAPVAPIQNESAKFFVVSDLHPFEQFLCLKIWGKIKEFLIGIFWQNFVCVCVMLILYSKSWIWVSNLWVLCSILWSLRSLCEVCVASRMLFGIPVTANLQCVIWLWMYYPFLHSG